MRLNVLLPIIGVTEFRLEDEREFDFLSLCDGATDLPCCTFVGEVKYASRIPGNITMVLTTKNIGGKMKERDYGVCYVDQPRAVYFRLHNYLSGADGYKREQNKTSIGERCRISAMSSIANDGVVIGNDVVIEEFAVVRENTVIGDRSIIRSGTSIGGAGFFFQQDDSGVFFVEHSGGVIIGQDVEIQQNCCVERALYPWDNTVIGDYTKISSRVSVGHAAKLEDHVILAGCYVVGGRTLVKRNAWIGLGAVVKNGIVVGENARVNIGAVVVGNVGDGETVTGNFAVPHDKFTRNQINILKSSKGKSSFTEN